MPFSGSKYHLSTKSGIGDVQGTTFIASDLRMTKCGGDFWTLSLSPCAIGEKLYLYIWLKKSLLSPSLGQGAKLALEIPGRI